MSDPSSLTAALLSDLASFSGVCSPLSSEEVAPLDCAPPSSLPSSLSALSLKLRRQVRSLVPEIESLVNDDSAFASCVYWALQILCAGKSGDDQPTPQGVGKNEIVALKIALAAAAKRRAEWSKEQEENAKMAASNATEMLRILGEIRELGQKGEQAVAELAPNLCAVVGTECAAKLISDAGGINELADMPACNIQVIGSKKTSALGLAKQGQTMYYGHFGELLEVRLAPEKYRTKMVKMFAN